MNTKKRKATPTFIAKLVAEELNIPDLSIKKRTRELIQARFIYYVLAKKFCRYASLDKIGKAVNRDHSTVIHGIKQFPIEAKHDIYMQDVYDKIYNELDPLYTRPGRDAKIDLTFEQILNRLNKLEKQLNLA